MKRSSRQRYLCRCQEITDDIHQRCFVEHLDFNESECCLLYGTSDYLSFRHELTSLGADFANKLVMPTVEWLYHSRHFEKMAKDESRAKRSSRINFIMMLIALVSACGSLLSNCSQNKREVYIVIPQTTGINNPDIPQEHEAKQNQ